MLGFALTDLLLILIVGSSVGFISGVFGVGGGFLIVPVLNIALGMPIEFAVGTAACQVLGPATTSVLARCLTVENFRVPLIVTGGLTVGVFAGANLLHHLTTDAASRSGSQGENIAEMTVLSVYLPLLLILGGFSLWESQRALAERPIKVGWIAGWKIPPAVTVPGHADRVVSIPVLSWFGLGVGFLSGLLGISGGLLLLPGLTYLLSFPWRAAVRSSTSIVWLIAVQATIVHAWHEHVNLPAVIGLLVGGSFGARLGVQFGSQVSSARGRRSFGWLALATSLVIAIKLAALLSHAVGR